MSLLHGGTDIKLNGRRRYKHSAEKVQKMENVMEKYKKKLEESAELRRLVKVRRC